MARTGKAKYLSEIFKIAIARGVADKYGATIANDCYAGNRLGLGSTSSRIGAAVSARSCTSVITVGGITCGALAVAVFAAIFWSWLTGGALV